MDGPSAAGNAQRLHNVQQRYQLPPGARQLLLVRHGSSQGATDETLQLNELSISDPALTAEGHNQASALAAQLGREAIARIFTSPLRRTRETAAPLAAATGLEPCIVADLREVHLGDWEHSFYEHAAAGHPLLTRMFAEENWEMIPNAEDMAAFGTRVRRGIELAAASLEPGTTGVVFSHAATIAEICRQATGSRAFAFTAPDNSSVSRLVVEAHGSWRLRSFNELSHLGYD